MGHTLDSFAPAGKVVNDEDAPIFGMGHGSSLWLNYTCLEWFDRMIFIRQKYDLALRLDWRKLNCSFLGGYNLGSFIDQFGAAAPSTA